MADKNSKIVNVRYGIFNNPNIKKIEKEIDRWTKKGFRLASRQDHKPGFFTMLFTLGWARGRTELTFVRA